MPSKWSMIDNSFPTFSGQEPARVQIEHLTNYMYLLVEQMKYTLENLDPSNWNETELEKFQAETVKDVKKSLEKVLEDMKTLTESLKSLSENTEKLEKGQQSTDKNMEALQKAVNQIQKDLNKLLEVFQRTDKGTVLGKKGEKLTLLGDVYINGKLVE